MELTPERIHCAKMAAEKSEREAMGVSPDVAWVEAFMDSLKTQAESTEGHTESPLVAESDSVASSDDFSHLTAADVPHVVAQTLRETADLLNRERCLRWGDLWDGGRGVSVADEDFPRGIEITRWLHWRADKWDKSSKKVVEDSDG